MLEDWFDPQGQADVDNSDLFDELHRQDSKSDGLLVGRRTFEDLRGYWPHQSEDATGITDSLNRQQKYVVSATMTDPEWQNWPILADDSIAEVRALKELPAKDIVVTGSITLCHALIENGLVDEYRLFVSRGARPRSPAVSRRLQVPAVEARREQGLSKRHHVLALRPS